MSSNEIILVMINEICKNFFENAHYPDLEETINNRTYLHNLYQNNDAFLGIKDELEAAIDRAEFQSETQGFLLGFKEAIRIFIDK